MSSQEILTLIIMTIIIVIIVIVYLFIVDKKCFCIIQKKKLIKVIYLYKSVNIFFLIN